MLEVDKIYQGDCLEVMKDIDSETVDAIICDLPYNTTSNEWDVLIPFEPLWEQYNRIIKPKGNIILFANNRFMFQLYASQPKLYRYDLVWQKSKCGSPFTAKYMPMKKHENILVFGHSGAYYEPQMEKGEPYHRAWTPNKNNNHKYGIIGTEHHNDGTRHPGTILSFPQKWRRQDQVHPTQKPVELMEWLIRAYCPESGLVLDNCCGSGSTCIGAIRSNRHYIGIELEEKYINIAQERCDKVIQTYDTIIKPNNVS